jgi:RNA ligase
MILTRAIIQPYIDKGLVEAKGHPTLPLTIYNYSRECQFKQSWDSVTLQCRGLILDHDDKLVARGFNKFFNYEEVEHKNQVPLNDEYVYVQEKMDGSLGILFHYNHDWHMATRGSFESDQAKAGLEILKTKYNLDKFHPTVSYLCEIIYPENRIVVDYSEEKIMFLSAVLDGREVSWGTARALFHSSGILEEDMVITSINTIDRELFGSLKALNELGKEGFVLRFHPSNYRVKIKFDEYVRLHRLLTNFSNLDIWECLRNGDDLGEYLESVPDEFDSWVRGWIRALKFAFVMQEIEAKKIFADLLSQPLNTQKEEALWIQANCPKAYQGLVFSMLQGRDYSQTVWRMIRPDYQKPFWNR